jgi:hypothetical protein
LALSRTPCAFRLRQARTVSAAESDVPCRDDGAAPSVPLLGIARPEVPKHTRALCPSAEPSRQDRLYRAPVKVTRYAQSRTPSIDSIPTLRSKVAEWVNDVLSDFHPTRTPRLTRRSRPPCHGFTGPPRRATPQSARKAVPLAWADPARSPWRRCLSPISATDQLSRAPAGPLHSRAWGLHPSDRTLSAPSRRSPHRRAGDETVPSATAPVDRVNGFSGLE